MIKKCFLLLFLFRSGLGSDRGLDFQRRAILRGQYGGGEGQDGRERLL